MPRVTKENPLGLEPFEGSAVTEVGIEVSNAGGGLHEALSVDKDLAKAVGRTTIGDSRYILLRADCTKIRHQPKTGNEDQVKRVAIFRCTDATLISGDFAVDAINEQRDTIRRENEKITGQGTLGSPAPGEDGPLDGAPPQDTGEGFD